MLYGYITMTKGDIKCVVFTVKNGVYITFIWNYTRVLCNFFGKTETFPVIFINK